VFNAPQKNGGNICNFDNNALAAPVTPTFLQDVASGTLPKYAFIEPRYLTYQLPPQIANDNHPPHDMAYGDLLLATVYKAIRASSYWKKKNIMLIVTYDEHGGCYDHVAPPAAVNPGTQNLPPVVWPPAFKPFPAQLFGPRVPTLVISP